MCPLLFCIISPTRLRRVLTSAFGPPSPPIPASGRVRAYPEVKDGLDFTTYCIVMRHLWATVRGHEATYMPLLYLGEVYQWLRIMSHMIGNVPEWFPVRDT